MAEPVPQMTLYQFAFSHFNEKARWALELKGLPSDRKNLMPGFHAKTALKLSGQSQVPILVGGDDIVAGSSEILRYLDRVSPTPPLFPKEAGERREVDDWLEWLDDEVGPATRLGLFHAIFEDASYSASIFTTGQPAWKRIPMQMMMPRMLPMLRERMDIRPETAAIANETTRKALDRIASAAEATGYLVSDSFTAADLTAACLTFPLSFPKELRFEMPKKASAALDAWKAKWVGLPGVLWMEEIFRKHRRSAS